MGVGTMPGNEQQDKTYDTVTLLCPRCAKRLPLGGTLSMRGTTGIFCRHCRRTVQVTMEMVDKDNTGETRDQ